MNHQCVDVEGSTAYSPSCHVSPYSSSSKDDSVVAFMATFVAISLFFVGFAEQHVAIPFTLEEWMWAARDGYLDTMISHFLRNGGL